MKCCLVFGVPDDGQTPESGAWFIVQLQGVATEFWSCIVKMLTCCECWFMHCQFSVVGLPLDKDGVND